MKRPPDGTGPDNRSRQRAAIGDDAAARLRLRVEQRVVASAARAGPGMASAPLVDPSALAPLEPPLPGPVSDEDVARAARRPRELPYQAEVSDDDQVVIHCLGFRSGRAEPFTARYSLVVEPGDDDSVPGLRAAVVGKRVGESVTFALPGDEGVRIAAEIVAARSFELPAPDDDEALDAARAMAEEQRALEHQTRRWQAVLDAAEQSHVVSVHEQDVAREIERQWEERERPALQRFGVPPDEQRELLAEWLESPELRAYVSRQLARGALVRVFGENRGIALDARGRMATALSVVPGVDSMSAGLLRAEAVLEGAPPDKDDVLWMVAALERLAAEALPSARDS